MNVRKMVLWAYILAGFTPGFTGFLWWMTGWAVFKGLAIAGLCIFVILAVLYATSDKEHFEHAIEDLQAEMDQIEDDIKKG